MFGSRLRRDKKSRRRAAFLCMLVIAGVVSALGGCARFDPNDHPLLSTLRAFVPFGDIDVSQQAQKIQYATIALTLNGRGGLLVLAQQQPGLTYWQSSQAETVVLGRGYLVSTAGLDHDLLSTELSGLGEAPSLAGPFIGSLDTTRTYKIMRQWQYGEDNRTRTGRADATLTCASGTESVQLPLADLSLRQCSETLHWENGATTRSTYWIDPKDNRIWKARTRPWPGGPTVAWQVARPWW